MWLIITLASLSLLLVLLLSIPVNLIFCFDTNRQPKASLSFSWMFGLISKRLGGKKKKPKVPRKKKEKKKGSRFRFWNLLRTKGLLRQMLLLLKGILSCIHLRKFELQLKLGLDSPADTGFLFGYVYAVRGLLPTKYNIAINPEFSEAIIEGHSSGTVTLTPICFVGPLFRFVFSKASLRVFWGIITGRWKKKK